MENFADIAEPFLLTKKIHPLNFPSVYSGFNRKIQVLYLCKTMKNIFRFPNE